MNSFLFKKHENYKYLKGPLLSSKDCLNPLLKKAMSMRINLGTSSSGHETSQRGDMIRGPVISNTYLTPQQTIKSCVLCGGTLWKPRSPYLWCRFCKKCHDQLHAIGASRGMW